MRRVKFRKNLCLNVPPPSEAVGGNKRNLGDKGPGLGSQRLCTWGTSTMTYTLVLLYFLLKAQMTPKFLFYLPILDNQGSLITSLVPSLEVQSPWLFQGSRLLWSHCCSHAGSDTFHSGPTLLKSEIKTCPGAHRLTLCSEDVS